MPKFTLKDAIYFSIVAFIIALTALAAIRTIDFISGAINTLFSSEKSLADRALRVDTQNYLIVAKKLGLTVK